MCTSFQSSSNELCHSLALLASRLCTTFVDTKGLAPLLCLPSCCFRKESGSETNRNWVKPPDGLLPRPFCTSPEKIYSKQQAHSSSMLVRWLGRKLRAIHGMNLAFHYQGSDAVLLVDAINVFNHSIDRQLFITSDIYALPLQQSSSTPIVSPQISFSMTIPFFLRREQLRVTPWLCPCMH